MRVLSRLIIVAVLVVMLALGGAESAHADQMVAASDVASLIDWVETRTNIMLLPRPRIFLSAKALGDLAGDHAQYGHETIAAYRNGRIYLLPKFWSPGNVADDSVIVHELVHYAQDLREHSTACRNQREAEAYQLQNEYLLEHSERPIIDAVQLRLIGKC